MAEEEHSSIPLELTVVDVYKWAAEIGQEFERLIDTFGAESVTDLMPKVVRVLEQLEKLVDRDEKEHNEVSELKLDVQRLQAMYLEKSEQNARVQKDLEQVDESWKEEAKELLQTISRLREENKQLNTALSSHTAGQHAQAKDYGRRTSSSTLLCPHTLRDNMPRLKDLEQVDESWKEEAKELLQTISRLREENKQLNTALSSHTAGQHAQAKEISESDFEVMGRLKETVDRQRATLRAKDMEINQRNMELEALQSQVERLAKVNHDLRRKQALTQQQGKSLVEEKAHLQASLQGKEQEIAALKDRLGLKGDLGDQIIKEMMESLEALQTEDGDSSRGKEEPPDQTPPDDPANLDGKLVIDLSDPDRPRFTMTELRSVLQEKNELKIRLMEVEDELSKYKNKLTKSTQTLPGEVFPDTNTVWTQTYNPVEDPFMESSVDNRDSDPDEDSSRSSDGSLYFDSDHYSLMRDPESEDETDAPVPDLPEPAAQQPQQESGIKKLFSFFSRSKASPDPPSPSSSHQPSPSPALDVSESDSSISEEQQQPHSTETTPVPDETTPVQADTVSAPAETAPTESSVVSDQAEQKNGHSQENSDNDQEVDKAEEASETVATDGKVPEMLLCSGV
ncbi:RILP-like protein homolog [Branchiostoma floridae]|uniref:RILP-like protein homolog n=1 Tax=Branchiostoma floridae TaxID=7739 RepID=A0A9J7LYU5_BRAFL|nr:RILP-like protein homolog [Branchiostoma floridae]